ncbi:MAG: ATP-grasp domain-containing protein [Acidimicrobiia bacterium]|nr:ATP-grasp domain-containing protein [Acidimicrobiia bacterium]
MNPRPEPAFSRIAIANRGEAAMRLIRAVRDENAENGTAYETVALYTQPDAHAMFVREADRAHALGAPFLADDRTGRRHSVYVDLRRMEAALLASGADAVWPGWGFLAENAEFAELCARHGITFMGPPPHVMRVLGDKVSSKELAEKAEVPVVPWSGGVVETEAEARYHAARLGYPVVVKAAAGGGGRGIRLVRDETELDEAFVRARQEAEAAFGDARVFIERAMGAARHVEVQIAADVQGTVWAVGVRDCSVQRRHQKVLEESASTALTPDREGDLARAAVRIAEVSGYAGVGTVEFLYDPATDAFAFMEVNARLQVEHTVTEAVTGLDLVRLQMRLAAGGSLVGEPPRPRGHAVEVRLCAEDPDNAFAPAPGRVALFRAPAGPGIRVDAGVTAGDSVPAEFDSMIAKIVAWGASRDESLARLRRALAETSVVIEGGATNKGLLLHLAAHPRVVEGTADIRWLDKAAVAGEDLTGDVRLATVALVQAAIEVYDTETEAERTRFLSGAVRGRATLDEAVGRDVELRHRGATYRGRVQQRGGDRFRVTLGGQTYETQVTRLGAYERRVTLLGATFRTVAVAQGMKLIVEVDGAPHTIGRDDGATLRAPAPGVVVTVCVVEGDVVREGERVAVLESMKMELAVAAPFAGRVREVLTAANDQVDAGSALVRLESVDRSQTAKPAGELTSPTGETASEAPTVRDRCLRALADMAAHASGYDVTDGEAGVAVESYASLVRDLPVDDPATRRAELEVLEAFADMCVLSRHRPERVPGVLSPRRAAREHFNQYLRSIEQHGAGLPDRFMRGLERALARYGVGDLEVDPDLEEALFRIARAQRHLDGVVPAVLAILERRLELPSSERSNRDPKFAMLLDRLISAAELRHPPVEDLAREVRFRFVDGPLYAAARRRAIEDARAHLVAIVEGPTASRDEHMGALVESPYQVDRPLLTSLWERQEQRDLLLEMLVRRIYRGEDLCDFVTSESGVGRGTDLARCHLRDADDRVDVVTAVCLDTDMAAVLAHIAALTADLPAEREIVIDLTLLEDEAGPAPDAGTVAGVVQSVRFARTPTRLTVAVGTGKTPGSPDSIEPYTFVPDSDGGLRERREYRGIHPAQATRLQLDRLTNFHLERLPSSEDVWLFRGVARENEADERLFALAEVRDMTPIRDAAGRAVGMPHFERVLHECVAAIRIFQSRRPAGRRLHWNRVFLHIWPPVDISSDEIYALSLKGAPLTEGLGIEKVVLRGRFRRLGGSFEDATVEISSTAHSGIELHWSEPKTEPLLPLSDYRRKVVTTRSHGTTYPYEIVEMLAAAGDARHSDLPPGEFEEHDLDSDGTRLVPVTRPYGRNEAGIVCGLVRNFTEKYAEGVERVILLGDPTRQLGALAEAECRRILAALDLAEERSVPVEWYAVSAGARIAMDSGTENMDWISRVLRRIVDFTQTGGEINVVVNGINVGAQPYWNAEATMLMHTRGILVMTPEGAMVLTGKQSLDFSGGVSAEDNLGIGGYDRVMGPDGQAQYWAPDLRAACRILFEHYAHTYVARGEHFPRDMHSTDPVTRDVRLSPHPGEDFETIGDVFSAERNAERKRPFDIRAVMRAVTDQDSAPLERWPDMADAETAVVWDAHLGGHPVCLIGIESKPLARHGFHPADGPETWTAGTLFPQSSKKVARAFNSASGNRPVVVLANLSGFDGSPESMRKLQLEYGAEIGRAVVNFRGPVVFCVVSRYHGGAFVVFSHALHDNMQVLAVEGSFASVIGGAPAAGVVFAGEVRARTSADPRVRELEAELEDADAAEKAALMARLDETAARVRAEKLGEVAEEFDAIHTIGRARDVGSVHDIVAVADLRPRLIRAVEDGMERDLGS